MVLLVKSPAELTELFRDQGLKITPQRVCIFEALFGSTEHPTAETVYEQVRVEMPSISLRTVYQTLNDLAAMGEIQAFDLGTGSARFDPNVDHHQHLVCTACGTVRDVYLDTGDLTPAHSAVDGFHVTSTEVVFRGLCATCATRPAGSP
mgnify:CR=1 FL=1